MSEYEEMMGADFCEHDIIDQFSAAGESETGSISRRRSNFGIIRTDGTPRGSLRRRSHSVVGNGVGREQDDFASPTQIVISTVGENNAPELERDGKNVILFS